jgi:hypothetical protein
MTTPPNDDDADAVRHALTEAINQAKRERSRPLRKEQYRNELGRLIKIYACLYAREHGLTSNIDVLRDLEHLEATVFINRTSVQVETVRQRAMDYRAEVWEQVMAVMDLLENRDG